MTDIIGKRKIFFGISGVLLAASLAALFVWGLKLGIDFTGGSIMELHFPESRPETIKVAAALDRLDLGNATIQTAGEKEMFIRTRTLDEETHQRVFAGIKESLGETVAVEERSFESVGPTIGVELRRKSLGAIAMVLTAIILYIAFAFRKVSEPVASWKFGISAVLALFHDVLIPAGIFAALGRFLGYEIDTLFVTAILTVLGFSVHDTIVVFDRIRENLVRHTAKTFEETVNLSVNETMRRSINTSLTVLLVLLAVYLFGGASTKHFTLVLIIGVAFGTYSSIFVASPLLVEWYRLGRRGSK